MHRKQVIHACITDACQTNFVIPIGNNRLSTTTTRATMTTTKRRSTSSRPTTTTTTTTAKPVTTTIEPKKLIIEDEDEGQTDRLRRLRRIRDRIDILNEEMEELIELHEMRKFLASSDQSDDRTAAPSQSSLSYSNVRHQHDERRSGHHNDKPYATISNPVHVKNRYRYDSHRGEEVIRAHIIHASQ